MLIGSKVTREAIERGLFKKLASVLEANNHYPSPVGKTEVEFNTALDALRTANEMIIGIESVGSGFNKGIDYDNRLVLYRAASANGDYGQNVDYLEEKDKAVPSDPTTYVRLRQDGPVTDLEYEVRYTTDDTAYDREMERMMTLAFRKRIYITSIDEDGNDGQEFFFIFRNEIDLSTKGSIERVYRYAAKDICLVTPDVIRDNIPEATIEFEVEIKTE